jgi:hypothetical protein
MLKIALIVLGISTITACTNQTGSDYFECLFLINNNTKKLKNSDGIEICNQLHPARLATKNEIELIDLSIFNDQTLNYKNIKVINKNSNFMATEVIILFKHDGSESTIKFNIEAKPLIITWSGAVSTDVPPNYEFSVVSVKGRPYK